ncbi:MAG: hypothetical protein QOE90_238 [Thermoplasmata archaeon]|jgi:hypothetical protein|nr:hypothetical protein [Thermoplasmata archaeon]
MSEEATIAEMVEALLVFDEPILNSRFHGMLTRHPKGQTRDDLMLLPAKIIQAGRLAHEGSLSWMRKGNPVLDDAFVEWAERMLLDSFLGMVDSQSRLIAAMARAAPTQESRKSFDQMAEIHREIAHTLRQALTFLAKRRHGATALPPHEGLRSVQEEEAGSDLRGQIETAMRAQILAGRAIRHVTLSPTALRHLRDQGCFRQGETTLGGSPVVVDMGWDASAFVLNTFDAVPLEEIMREAGPKPRDDP